MSTPGDIFSPYIWWGRCQQMLVNTIQRPGSPQQRTMRPHVNGAGLGCTQLCASAQGCGCRTGTWFRRWALSPRIHPPHSLGGRAEEVLANHTPAYRHQALCSEQIPRQGRARHPTRSLGEDVHIFLSLKMKLAPSQQRSLNCLGVLGPWSHECTRPWWKAGM